jgi:ABC-type multidrug transport system fused ATPase/permease subunit
MYIFIATTMTKQAEEEKQALLSDKKTSHDAHNHNQHHSSPIEWAELSWTRILHVLCWFWINPILSLGYKQQLVVNDLGDIPHIDKSSVLLDRLRSYDWLSTTTSRIIIKEFSKDYIIANLYLLPFLIVRITQPLVFRQLILNMMNKQGSNTVNYLYAVVLFSSVLIQTLMHRQNIFRSARVGARIRNSLIMIIYSRSLSLKSSSWEEMNIGQTINLIANDASKFEEVCANFAYLCEGLTEMVIIFILLCWIVQPIPTLCGFAIFPFFILVQLYFSRKFGQYREIIAKCTDKRIQAFSEFIHGCNVIKMYNWEKLMEDRLIKMRENELGNIRRISRFRALNMTQFFISTSFLALTTFGSAWLLGYPLNAANTFPVLSFFSLMRVNVMYYLPLAIEKLGEAKVSAKRIDLFMRMTIKPQYQSLSSASPINQQQKGNISMTNASFSWHNEIPCLSLVNLSIKQGTFVGIVGPVGSGKSSLLAAILGEMNLISGESLTNDSSFSYANQSPWILADTFRNNILLNRPFDEQRYRNTIYACCLDIDLSLVGSSGDLTVIGEKGVNLSGGQKARVSLARALYADADIYLLDDPLSAVDSKVATQIYKRCIGADSLLKHKTRLLVTHQTQFLSETHQIIFLSHGHIDEQGYLGKNIIRDDDNDKNETSVLASMLDGNTSIVDAQPITTEEISLNGSSRWSVWYHLFTASPFGRFGFCLLIVSFLLCEAFNDGANYWLSIWLKQTYAEQQHSSKFAYIYFGLIIGTVITDIVRTNYYFSIILHGSNSLHNNMLRGLLHTSMQFFESNPSGRILNRASRDQYVMDELLPPILLDGLVALLMTIGSIFVICFINPFIFLVFIIIIPVVYLITRFYQRSSRQLKRLESITRSPVYELFSTSLNGSSTIRAFKAESSFIQLISNKIDANTTAYLTVQAASHWLAVRLYFICSLVLLIASIQMVSFRHQTDIPTASLTLMSAIYLSLWFQWAVRQLCEADILITSGERIDEYSYLPQEDDMGGNKRLVKTSPEWPTDGTIEFRNYSLRHRLNLKYAIRNINLRIESGQKIGIIGRTGTY